MARTQAVVARTYVEVDDDTRDAIKWAEQMAESFAAEVGSAYFRLGCSKCPSMREMAEPTLC